MVGKYETKTIEGIRGMKECIILAGGFGTRLQTVVKDVPKCMAEVAGKPFLEYLFTYLSKENFNHVVLALGYKAESIVDWISLQNTNFKLSYVVEHEPLGTGGAIKLAFSKIQSDNAFVINGDTFFDVFTGAIQEFSKYRDSDIAIALKPMSEFDRYGSVELNHEDRIVKFNEKQFCEQGLINGGIYFIQKSIFSKLRLPEKFSFEKDILEKELGALRIFGCTQDSYFIDIGIPSDFEKANVDFKKYND